MWSRYTARLHRCEIVQICLVHHNHVFVLLVRIAEHVLPHVRRFQLAQRRFLVFQILLIVAHVRDRQTVAGIFREYINTARWQMEEVFPHPCYFIDQVPARNVVRIAIVFRRRRLYDGRYDDRVAVEVCYFHVHFGECIFQHRMRDDVTLHLLGAAQLRCLELMVCRFRLL
uniref:Uncharacterized protein n=1 Tax=Anopheles funestus TaxID=62324 RepID=A0A182S2Y8_ANOFN